MSSQRDAHPSADDLKRSLETLLRALEVANRERFLTSILLLSDDGGRLRCFAAPSLPKAYCDAIDGEEIGPAAGSCGTAAYLGHDVFVTDIAADPRWRSYRAVALEHDLRACWSTPMFGAEGQVLGTFAIYHQKPTGPAPHEVEAIRLAARAVAGLLQAVHGAARPRRP